MCNVQYTDSSHTSTITFWLSPSMLPHKGTGDKPSHAALKLQSSETTEAKCKIYSLPLVSGFAVCLACISKYFNINTDKYMVNT